MTDELRAANAADLDWVGRAPTATPASRVRDVLLIPTSSARGDWDAHPPVRSPPVDLGRGLKLTELDHHDAELVLNALRRPDRSGVSRAVTTDPQLN
jgi:hypothetical protein